MPFDLSETQLERAEKVLGAKFPQSYRQAIMRLEPGRDEDVDELWLDEAEQRLQKHDQGATQARDAEDAIADIERQLT